MKINIKPLSVNQVWQGKRFKTIKYKNYECECLLILPKKYKVPDGNLQLNIIFGFSNKLSDIDNCLKPFIDILQKKYDFNDKMIYIMNVTKVDVKKGDEFIDWGLVAID